MFVSRLWQIHIFSEGNTRATAVFFIKYLRTLGLDVTLDEMQVLNLLKKDGKLTQKKMGELIGKSDRTVKCITASLEAKKYIERVNGKRLDYWKVNIE